MTTGINKDTTKTFRTYAPDGKDVGLRVEVIVLGIEGTVARIFMPYETNVRIARLVDHLGPSASPCWNTDGVAVTVPASSLSAAAR